LSGRVVNEVSSDAGGLNLRESFCAAFSVNVFVHNLLRGLRETRAADATEYNATRSQQKLSSGRNFHQMSVARCSDLPIRRSAA
jgi:hypothetical protein